MKYTIALLILLSMVTIELHGQPIKDRKFSDKFQKDPVQALLLTGPPIITGLSDAKWGDTTYDGFYPREPLRTLSQLQRTPNGGFVLQPGHYRFSSQSYCLKIGGYQPGAGDGYLYAPTMGAMDEIIETVIRNSVQHPEIPQQDVQILLWTIMARAKFEDLQSNIIVLAAKLMTPKQLFNINTQGVEVIPQTLMDKGTLGMPQDQKAALEAENKLRGILTNGTVASYSQLEAIAVLKGIAPVGKDSKNVPSGRWSLHPDGYYIRYVPNSYTNTVVEIWVPQGSAAAGKEYDPATHIAVPGNTSLQLLIQSGRPYYDN